MAQSSTTYTTTYTSAPVRTVKTERTPLRGKVRDSTGCCGDVCDMAAFEYRADVKDLELDGRHWRELFGGATGGGTKMGAYIICGPNAFVLFRIFLAMCATGIFCWTLVHGFKTDTQGYWALYFTNWTVTISCAYFILAAALTSYAVCTNGQESRSTPFLVWFCWILYGMLVPSAQIAFLAYWLVIFDGTVYAVSIAATVGTLVIVLLDMWINRQPYYYSFHAIFGVTIKCATAAPPAPASGLAARGPRPSSMRSQKQRPPPPLTKPLRRALLPPSLPVAHLLSSASPHPQPGLPALHRHLLGGRRQGLLQQPVHLPRRTPRCQTSPMPPPPAPLPHSSSRTHPPLSLSDCAALVGAADVGGQAGAADPLRALPVLQLPLLVPHLGAPPRARRRQDAVGALVSVSVRVRVGVSGLAWLEDAEDVRPPNATAAVRAWSVAGRAVWRAEGRRVQYVVVSMRRAGV